MEATQEVQELSLEKVIESKYNPINDNGDFIEPDCLFEANGLMYEYSGVVHDKCMVYGRKLNYQSPLANVDRDETSFNFSQVSMIYKPHNPNQ